MKIKNNLALLALLACAALLPVKNAGHTQAWQAS